MKQVEKLNVLMKLPYTTISLFDGKKVTQKTVVFYDEVIDEINLNRKELLKKGYRYFNGKLLKINPRNSVQ